LGRKLIEDQQIEERTVNTPLACGGVLYSSASFI